jgi:transcriptional regulator with XRE-family HTH domain
MDFDRAGFEQEVAKRLQLHRKNRGITQDGLAKRIGMTRPSYANIEAGRQRIPLDVVWRAAVVLGVSISALVPEPLNRPSAVVLPMSMTTVALDQMPATAVSSLSLSPQTFMPETEAPRNVRVIRKQRDTTTS